MSFDRPPIALAIVPPEAVPQVWDELAIDLERAVLRAGGTHSPKDIYDEAVAGRNQLWVARKHGAFLAVAVTRVVIYPQFRALSVDWVGGHEMDQWLDWWYGRLKDFAKANGCTCIEGFGRTGWARALQRQGMRAVATVYRAEL